MLKNYGKGIRAMNMNNLEFYIFEDELWAMSDEGNEKVTEGNTDIVNSILKKVSEYYPEAYEALQEAYKKSSLYVPHYQFLMANRFCKCNFGELDSQKIDVDSKGVFNFERVRCPLRGECKYENIICNPKFSSRLSDAEYRVMKLVYDGDTNEVIAEKLYRSVETIKSQVQSSYRKLGVNSRSELIRDAQSNNLF